MNKTLVSILAAIGVLALVAFLAKFFTNKS